MVSISAGFIGPQLDGTAEQANPLDTRRVETYYALGGGQVIRNGFVYSTVAGQMQLSFTAGEALVAERDGSGNELRRGYLAWSDVTKIVQFQPASPGARNDAVVLAVVDVEDGVQGTGLLGVGGHLVPVPGQSGSTAARTDAEITAYLGRGGWLRIADVAIPAGSSSISTGNIIQNPVAYKVASVPSSVVKTASQSVASSIVLVDDNDLKVTLPVGLWRVSALLSVVSSGTIGDFKCAWSFAGTLGPNPARACLGPATDTSATTTNLKALTFPLTTEVPYGALSGQGVHIQEDLFLPVTAAGLLTLRWAQNASNANAAVLEAGSRLFIDKRG